MADVTGLTASEPSAAADRPQSRRSPRAWPDCCCRPSVHAPPRTARARVTVAGGEPGASTSSSQRLLAESLQRHGVADQAVALTTGGSLDNLEHLLTGKATFAVALADAAAQQRSGR